MKRIRRFVFMISCLCILIAGASDLVPNANAASAMTASESCIAFIKKFEGFSAKPYYDYKQHTVGYGTKCPTEKYFDYMVNGIPKSEAERLLLDTVTDIAESIHKKLIDPYQLIFTQHQFDALVSFSFNVGISWMSYDSSLRNAILSNADENEFVYAFALYSTAGGYYSPGLITRRLCEANMYLNGQYSQKTNDAYGYVFYEPNGGSLTYQVQGFVCESNPVPVADAVRNGDVFTGWYTDLTGGSPVAELNQSLAGKTLFARWQSSENAEDKDTMSTLIRVTGDVVNIRTGPGTNYGITRQVRRNDQLILNHVSNIANRLWGKVQNGWICLEYTDYDELIHDTGSSDPTNPPPAETTAPEETYPESNSQENMNTVPDDRQSVSGTVRVNDILRIRSGPGITHETVGYLFNGHKVEILEQRTVGSMVWGRITRGWVSMDYIQTGDAPSDSTDKPESDIVQETEPVQDTTAPTEPERKPEPGNPEPDQLEDEQESSDDQTETSVLKGKIIADALRIRSAPEHGSRIVGFYYQNDPVIILEKTQSDSGYWGKTSKGWIHMDYVQTDFDSETSDTSDGGREMTVIADCLRVRRQTDVSSRIAKLLYYGDTVTVFETTTVDQVAWGRVSGGWICMDYVK